MLSLFLARSDSAVGISSFDPAIGSDIAIPKVIVHSSLNILPNVVQRMWDLDLRLDILILNDGSSHIGSMVCILNLGI